jgi:dihydroorotate dehydrogenase
MNFFTAQSLQSIAEGSAGAVVTNSMGLTPQIGYPNPTVVQALLIVSFV